MQARHQVSRNAIELIKRFEGYRASAAKLPDGRWTIGYGHTLTAREGAQVSAADAEALLMYDLIAVAHAVNEHAYAPLTQNQFDALSSFAFNIGVDNFLRSAVLRRVNEGALIQAACAMELWRKADFGGERIVIDALVRRRSAEKHLFLTPPDGWVAAPSPILPPKVDYDAPEAVPQQTPTAVVAPLTGETAEARLDVTAAPVVPEEDTPTVTEKAAAAVTARLVQLFPDQPRQVETPASEPAVEPASEPVATPELPAPLKPAAPLPPVLEGGVQPFPTETDAPIAEAAARPPSISAPPEAQKAPEAKPTEATEAKPTETPEAKPTETSEAKPAKPTPAARPVAQLPPLPPRLNGPEAPRSVASYDDDREPQYGVDRNKVVPLVAAGAISLVMFAGGVFGGLKAVTDHLVHPFPGAILSWLLCLLGAIGLIASTYLLLRLIDGEDEDV